MSKCWKPCHDKVISTVESSMKSGANGVQGKNHNLGSPYHWSCNMTLSIRPATTRTSVRLLAGFSVIEFLWIPQYRRRRFARCLDSEAFITVCEKRPSASFTSVVTVSSSCFFCRKGIDGALLISLLGHGRWLSPICQIVERYRLILIRCHTSGLQTMNETVAIKKIQKGRLNPASVENILLEIEILKSIKHDFIVEMKDFTVCWSLGIFHVRTLWLCWEIYGCKMSVRTVVGQKFFEEKGKKFRKTFRVSCALAYVLRPTITFVR